MKIAIDGSFLSDLNCGTGQFLHGLIRGLNDVDRDNEYLIYSPFDPTFNFRLRGNFRWRTVKMLRISGTVRKILWEQLYLPSAVSKDQTDILHVPYMSFPRFFNGCGVVTIYDIAGLKFKQYRKGIKWKMYYGLVRNLAVRVNGIITTSQFSKSEIVKHLNLTEERVRVIYGGADQEQAGTDKETLEKKYGLSKKFILYVGSDDYRKNVFALFGAYEQFALKHQYELIVVGRVKAFNIPGIRRIGEVSREDLIGLYRIASLLVHPSFYEGFGLVVLEAMRYGCPVVASTASSMPEVAGDAALLVDSTRPEEISGAMERILENPELADELRRKGKDRAARFRWSESAKKTIDFYRMVVNNKN